MIILVGAGIVGRMALEDYGEDKVAYFCDNNCVLTHIKDIPIINFDKIKKNL